MGCHALIQGIFPTRWSNLCLLCLLHWQTGSSLLSCLGSPCVRRASAPLHVLHPYALSQDAEYSSLGSPVGPYSLSVLYIIVCIC